MGDLSVGQAILVSQAAVDGGRALEKIALFDATGTPIATDDLVAANPPTGEDVLLTGMSAGEAAAVTATDTVNEAIAKLQAQYDALDGRVTTLEG